MYKKFSYLESRSVSNTSALPEYLWTTQNEYGEHLYYDSIIVIHLRVKLNYVNYKFRTDFSV